MFSQLAAVPALPQERLRTRSGERACRAARLLGFAAEVAADDVDLMLSVLCASLTGLFEAERVTVFERQPGSGALQPRGSNRLDVAPGASPAQEVAWLVASEKTVFNLAALGDHPDLPTDTDEGGVLAAPLLLAGGETMGVLVVEHRLGACFGEADEDLVRLVAGYLALALKNAQLEAERRRREERAALGTTRLETLRGLRTLLGTAQGYAERIEADGEETFALLEALRGELGRIEALTGALAGGPPQPAPEFAGLELVSLDGALSQALPGLMRDVTASGIGVDVQLGRAGTIRLDRRRFRRVLATLLDGARQALPAGTMLCLRTRRRGERAVLELRGNGPGLPLPERIWAPQLASDATHRHGSGLGLAVCRQIVEAHGGSLSLHEAPGSPGGARVELSFPRVALQPAA